MLCMHHYNKKKKDSKSGHVIADDKDRQYNVKSSTVYAEPTKYF